MLSKEKHSEAGYLSSIALDMEITQYRPYFSDLGRNSSPEQDEQFYSEIIGEKKHFNWDGDPIINRFEPLMA